MSSIPTIDFHGKKLEEAVNMIHAIVNGTRNQDLPFGEFRLITGHGIIKREIIRILKDDYKIEAREELGNSGVIRAYIE